MKSEAKQKTAVPSYRVTVTNKDGVFSTGVEASERAANHLAGLLLSVLATKKREEHWAVDVSEEKGQ